MASCVVRDWQGKEAGKATLDLKVAKETTAVDLMHRAVLRQQAHARQGTASTLTRSEVRGGGRKPYKQKGTGRARQGSIRTPLKPGGGIIFGPKPRTYNLAMNRKERRLALRTALMARIDDVTVVKDFGASLEAPKTREITDALGRLGGAAGSKVLIVLTCTELKDCYVETWQSQRSVERTLCFTYASTDLAIVIKSQVFMILKSIC